MLTGLSAQPVFFLSVFLGFLLFGLIARWYLLPLLLRMPLAQALQPLLLLHGFRYIGLVFVIPGVVGADLPIGFARPTAWGDLAAALLALAALAALRAGSGLAIPLAWVFNVFGALDLVNAFAQAARHGAVAGQLGAAYFIPPVAVPALLVTHYVIFVLLLRPRRLLA